MRPLRLLSPPARTFVGFPAEPSVCVPAGRLCEIQSPHQGARPESTTFPQVPSGPRARSRDLGYEIIVVPTGGGGLAEQVQGGRLLSGVPTVRACPGRHPPLSDSPAASLRGRAMGERPGPTSWSLEPRREGASTVQSLGLGAGLRLLAPPLRASVSWSVEWGYSPSLPGRLWGLNELHLTRWFRIGPRASAALVLILLRPPARRQRSAFLAQVCVCGWSQLSVLLLEASAEFQGSGSHPFTCAWLPQHFPVEPAGLFGSVYGAHTPPVTIPLWGLPTILEL